MRDLSIDELPPLTGDAILNLLRRGADGSLRLSADRWQLVRAGDGVVVFHSVTTDPADLQVLEVRLAEVSRVTWDRLPRQQARSQLRFHLANGDIWTFSGPLSEPAGGGII